MSVTLKMVRGKTFVCEPLLGSRVIEVGSTVEASDEAAEAILKEGYTDGLNNFHPYFEVVSGSPKAAPARKRKGKAADATDAADEADTDSDTDE